MNQLPSRSVLTSVIAGDGNASRTPDISDILIHGFQKEFSNEKIANWSSSSVAYKVGDKVVCDHGVYICYTQHTSSASNKPSPYNTSDESVNSWWTWIGAAYGADVWSGSGVSYRLGDVVIYNGYAYWSRTNHTSSATPTPDTDTTNWKLVGTGEVVSQTYLLRPDINALFYRLSQFWYAIQNAGYKKLGYDETKDSVVTTSGGVSTGGFPKSSVRVVDHINALQGYNETYFVASKKDDNHTAPDPLALLHEYISGQSEDPNWSLISPSLKWSGIFNGITYRRDGTIPSGSAPENNVFALPGATQNWGGGYCYNKQTIGGQTQNKKISSVFASSSAISEIWYMETAAESGQDNPRLRQVFGWLNDTDATKAQKLLGAGGITSGTTSITLMRGRYNVIVIGKGGGPYKGIHRPCAHCYGNPGDGGAGFAGTLCLEHGIYQVGCCAKLGSFLKFGDTYIVYAQNGSNTYMISGHVTNPVPYGSAPKITYKKSVCVKVNYANKGDRGKSNGMQSGCGSISGTGGDAPVPVTIFGIDCSGYGVGSSGYGGPGLSKGSVVTRAAGSGLVYIEYAGPYNGIPEN